MKFLINEKQKLWISGSKRRSFIFFNIFAMDTISKIEIN